MSHGEQYSSQDIIKALEDTRGAVTLAADRLGCSYKTIERRAEKVEAVRDVIEKYRKRRVDKAELKLEQAVDNGEPWAVLFTLKTQGKDRGYVERTQTELTGAGGGPVEHEVTVKDDAIIRKLLPELASNGTADATSTAE